MDICMNERDQRVVETMCLSGLDMDSLCRCFPKANRADLETIYHRVKRHDMTEDIHGEAVSCNCS